MSFIRQPKGQRFYSSMICLFSGGKRQFLIRTFSLVISLVISKCKTPTLDKKKNLKKGIYQTASVMIDKAQCNFLTTKNNGNKKTPLLITKIIEKN